MATNFKILKECGNARTGELETAHGKIQTPIFMPVGTAASVKAMTVEDLEQINAQIILGNTYHLMLRPTAERIAELGGLHKFTNWNKPILTDSGGFQVMSLSKIRKIEEEGVHFSSHIDGSKHTLSPERSIEIQHLLGADITMIFDECTPYPATHEVAKDSMELSLRWAERSKKAFQDREGYGLFGIVQGSIYEDLRLKSTSSLQDIDFDGMAIGGLAVGEGQEEMFRVLDFTVPAINKNKPRYLMGVGYPLDIIGAVMRGVDMFDCVIPTRNARNGMIFTKNGAINIKNAKYASDPTPIDENSDHPTLKNYSKAYLNHLVKTNEILGSMLCTQINLEFYLRLMEDIRAHIEDGTLEDFHEECKLKFDR